MRRRFTRCRAAALELAAMKLIEREPKDERLRRRREARDERRSQRGSQPHWTDACYFLDCGFADCGRSGRGCDAGVGGFDLSCGPDCG